MPLVGVAAGHDFPPAYDAADMVAARFFDHVCWAPAPYSGSPECGTLTTDAVLHVTYDDVLGAIGRTPSVRLRRVVRPDGAEVVAKLEYFAPGGSVKDRAALAMITDAERRGMLRPGATVVEASAGNTGVGLAMVCAVRGYRCVDRLAGDDVGRQARRARGARRGDRPRTRRRRAFVGRGVHRQSRIARRRARRVRSRSIREPGQPRRPLRANGAGDSGRLRRRDRRLRRVRRDAGGTLGGSRGSCASACRRCSSSERCRIATAAPA